MHQLGVSSYTNIKPNIRKKMAIGLVTTATLLTLIGIGGVITDGISVGPSMAALYGII